MTRPTVYSSIQTHPSLLLPTPLPSSAPFFGGEGIFWLEGKEQIVGLWGSWLPVRYYYSNFICTANLQLIYG